MAIEWRRIKKSTLDAIGNAIRAKTGKSASMTPAEMVTEIGSIQTGTTPTGTKQISIAQNGTTTENVAGYANAQISVNVPIPTFQTQSKTVTQNGTVTPDSGYDGLSQVTVNVPQGITPTGTKTITENGTHDVTNYASAVVNVPQGITPSGTKQITITENGTTTEDVSNYADAQISVNVPSSSDIATALQALGFTIVSDTVITGTRTSGNTSMVFADTGASAANGQGLIVVALDAPTMNQAVIRLEGNSDSSSCAIRRYPNDVKHGLNTNVNGFLQDGIRYRAIIYTP